MFSWSGLIDTNILLSEAFQVPNLKTGKMEPLITSLTQREEEQFANMLKRLNTVFQVKIKIWNNKYICNVDTLSYYHTYNSNMKHDSIFRPLRIWTFG